MGKLIVIDGLDGSGKQTQTELLEQALQKDGTAVRRISFPTYTKSSALIDLYLGGPPPGRLDSHRPLRHRQRHPPDEPPAEGPVGRLS